MSSSLTSFEYQSHQAHQEMSLSENSEFNTYSGSDYVGYGNSADGR